MKSITSTSLTMIALATLLTACGGGGGGDSSTPPVTTQPPVVVPPVVVPPVVVPPVVVPPAADENPLQLTLGDASYAAGSTLRSAYTLLNSIRNIYGVGLFAQNAKLDTSAFNHAQYVSGRWGALDFTTVGHLESASKPGFTGITPADRIAYAGYVPALAGEVLTTFISVDGVKSDPGMVAVNSLMSAPYHRFNLLDGNKEIGIADASAIFAGEGGTNHTFVFNTAVAQNAKSQLPAASWVGIWPADQAADVMYAFAGETPSPIPVNAGACAGYPVSVQVRNGLLLNTSTFTLIEQASNAEVPVQLSTAKTDANPSQARENTAYIIPFKPLKLATKYTAHFVGSVGGTAIEKTWSFTTGAVNTKLIYGCDPT